MSDALRKLIIAVAMQILLAGGLIKWQQYVEEHPTVSALICVLYEVGVLILAFGNKVWSIVEAEAVKRTSDWLLAAIKGFAPGFRRRYKDQVVSDHGIFNVRGLGLINTFTLELEHVFVDLKIAPSSNPQRLNSNPIAPKEFTGNRSIWNFLHLARILSILLFLSAIRDRDLALARDRVRALSRDQLFVSYRIIAAMQRKDYTEAQRLVEGMSHGSESDIPLLFTHLSNALAIANAKTELSARQEKRQYVADRLKSSYQNFDLYYAYPRWRRWLRIRTESLDNKKQHILKGYWGLKIVTARAEGNLPAWEGIRIVREQAQQNTK